MRFVVALLAAAFLALSCHNRSEEEVGAAPDRGDTTIVAVDTSDVQHDPSGQTGDPSGYESDTSGYQSDTTGVAAPFDTTIIMQ